MFFCSVLGCRSRAKPANLHKFPKDSHIREAWIKFTGRQNWEPCRFSRICVKHFNKSLYIRNYLHPKAIPTIASGNNLGSIEVYEIQRKNTLVLSIKHGEPHQVQRWPSDDNAHSSTVDEDNEAELGQRKHPSNVLEAMREEEWPVMRLENFAAAFVQHEILYGKLSRIRRKRPTSINERLLLEDASGSLHQLNREFALGRLAGALGLPNDHNMAARCAQFRYQLLRYIRKRVRESARRGEGYTGALNDAPTHAARLARELNLVPVVVQAELSTADSPVRRWAVDTLVQELSRTVRYWSASYPAPSAAPLSELAAAPAAVFKGARPVSTGLWNRLKEIRLRQLLKLSLGGDRAEALPPGEELRPCDWHLIDTLILHDHIDVTSETEMLLHWCDSLRALVVLVQLLGALAAPLDPPAPPPHSDSEHTAHPAHVALWRAVYDAYTATGRHTSPVVLQHRWQRLLWLARHASRAPQPHGPQPHEPHPRTHPLLRLIAASFPRIIQRTGYSWQSLVRNGLVATAEEINSLKMNQNPKVPIPFVCLEKCMTTQDIIRYIERTINHMDASSRVRFEHNPDISYSSDFEDCATSKDPLGDCVDAAPSLRNTDETSVENAASTDHTVAVESDVEIIEELTVKVEKVDEKIQNSPKVYEIEIDTTRDYINDILMEEESLKTLDDIDENSVDDCVTDDRTSSVKFFDDDENEHIITISQTGQLIFNPPLFGPLAPKLMSIPRVKLKRMNESMEFYMESGILPSVKRGAYITPAPKVSQEEYAEDDSVEDSDSDVIELKDSPPPIVELDDSNDVTYISESDSENDKAFDAAEFEFSEALRNIYPEENAKRVVFYRNQKLLEMCKPVSVVLTRLKESEIPRRRVVKRVELPDIDEVRRINRNILTAEVGPTYVQNDPNKKIPTAEVGPTSVQNDESSSTQEYWYIEALEHKARELMAPVDDEVARVDLELQNLFSIERFKVDKMIMTAIYDSDVVGSDSSKGSVGWKEQALDPRPLSPPSPPPPPPPDAVTDNLQRITTNKYFDRSATKTPIKCTDDDLDDMLSCTIIRKPSNSNVIETDVETQPFFVSSNEDLLQNSESTPVITGVCSLADNVPNKMDQLNPDDVPIQMDQLNPEAEVVNPLDNIMDTINKINPVPNNTDSMARKLKGALLAPLQEAVRRLGAVNVGPKKKRSSGTTHLSGTGDREQFAIPVAQQGTHVDLAMLTPVILKDAHTSTITLAPATHTPTHTYTSPQVVVMATPGNQLLTSSGNTIFLTPSMTSQVPTVMPTLTIGPNLLMTSQMTPQIMPQMRSQMTPQMTLQMTPQMTQMRSQMMPQMTSQMTPQMTSQMTPQMTLQMTPQMTSVIQPQTLLPMSSDVNVIGLKDTPEGRLVMKVSDDWVEPGHTIPHVSLTFNVITGKDYVAKYGPERPVVRLDSSKPLWAVAREYLILTEKMLPCTEPTYWTLGSPKECSELVLSSSETSNPEPQIVIGNVVGNYHEPVIDVSDSDEEVRIEGQSTSKTSTLKVKSFADCGRMEQNKLKDVVKHHNNYYKKLTDEPILYAKILTVVSSTEECDNLLRERAPLFVWSRRSGQLSTLDVSLATREPVLTTPITNYRASMPPALLIRHSDLSFLTDFAAKFQLLNSENAFLRENQVYVFAPNSGTLLVGPST